MIKLAVNVKDLKFTYINHVVYLMDFDFKQLHRILVYPIRKENFRFNRPTNKPGLDCLESVINLSYYQHREKKRKNTRFVTGL